jgi:hypothetical protein
VALYESKLLWPLAGQPNLIVSIGTGFEESTNEDSSYSPMLYKTRKAQKRKESIVQHTVSNNDTEIALSSWPIKLTKVLTQGYIKYAKDVFLNSPAINSNQD